VYSEQIYTSKCSAVATGRGMVGAVRQMLVPSILDNCKLVDFSENDV